MNLFKDLRKNYGQWKYHSLHHRHVLHIVKKIKTTVCPDLCQLIGAFILCFHALLTRYSVKESTENEQWLLYNEIRQSTGCFKKCKKLSFLAPFLPRNHTAGSCSYMRTTTITLRLATTQSHPPRVVIQDART